MVGSPRPDNFADLNKALLREGFVVSGSDQCFLIVIVSAHLLRVIFFD